MIEQTREIVRSLTILIMDVLVEPEGIYPQNEAGTFAGA